MYIIIVQYLQHSYKDDEVEFQVGMTAYYARHLSFSLDKLSTCLVTRTDHCLSNIS